MWQIICIALFVIGVLLFGFGLYLTLSAKEKTTPEDREAAEAELEALRKNPPENIVEDHTWMVDLANAETVAQGGGGTWNSLLDTIGEAIQVTGIILMLPAIIRWIF